VFADFRYRITAHVISATRVTRTWKTRNPNPSCDSFVSCFPQWWQRRNRREEEEGKRSGWCSVSHWIGLLGADLVGFGLKDVSQEV